MAYTILSWNLEHMRTAKLSKGKNPGNFAKYVMESDIAFFFESKTACHTTAADILNDADGNVPKFYLWVGEDFVCHGADNERVICVYRNQSIKSLNRNPVVQKAVNKILTTGQRPPVVLDLVFSDGSKLVVAPWHAAGPAANMAQDLFAKVKQLGGIDLVFGDFNWEAPLDPEIPSLDLSDSENDDDENDHDKETTTEGGKRKSEVEDGPRRSKRIKANYDLFEKLEMGDNGQPVNKTSTYTAKGDTNRNKPLDRCCVSVTTYKHITIYFKRYTNCGEMIDLTNHYPLYIKYERN